MASQAGMFAALDLSPEQALYTPHNSQSRTPGLPVKEEVILYVGTMVAYDPASELAEPADPAMPATAKVIGITEDTIDNLLGADGDKFVKPRAGVWRVASDGNLTTEHLFTQVIVVDDHTVGVPAGDDSDRFAGLLVGLEGDYAWVLILPQTAQVAPGTLAAVSTANGSDAATTQALANALKTHVNALHAILAARGIVAPAA